MYKKGIRTKQKITAAFKGEHGERLVMETEVEQSNRIKSACSIFIFSLTFTKQSGLRES